METQPTPHAHATPRPSSLRRALLPALVFSLVPLSTAYAQSQPLVRVTRDGTDISSLRGKKIVRMRAPQGTVLEVMYIEGDRYRHLDSNWYWVLLPLDPWGSRPAGWIRGDAVEHVPPPAPAAAAAASRAEALYVERPQAEPMEIPAPRARVVVESAPAAAVPSASSARPVLLDVVLNFEFGRSELTDEARRRLDSAVAVPTANTGSLSVALEGHADWTGPGAYNERLGQARAETVRRYLAEQFRIPAERITVVSYGENNPVAPNTTREGRARNRRVVIKGGA